jgi:hypothetical protein
LDVPEDSSFKWCCKHRSNMITVRFSS